MSDGFDVKVDRRDPDRLIKQLSLFLSDLRPFWPIVSRLVRSWWTRQFDTEGGFAGTPWPALSPKYREWKQQHYPGKKILVATGATKRAALNPTRTVTPRTLTLAVDSEILGYHQEGDGVPKRPLIFEEPLPAQARIELDAAAEGYVTDLLRRLT